MKSPIPDPPSSQSFSVSSQCRPQLLTPPSLDLSEFSKSKSDSNEGPTKMGSLDIIPDSPSSPIEINNTFTINSMNNSSNKQNTTNYQSVESGSSKSPDFAPQTSLSPPLTSTDSYQQLDPTPLKNEHKMSFVEQVRSGIQTNIEECSTTFRQKSSMSAISSWKAQFEKASKTLLEKNKRLDNTSQVEGNMELVLLFFKTSQHMLHEMYRCDNIETVFGKRQVAINTHQLIEKCKEEMDEYVSVLEYAKTNSNSASSTPNTKQSKPSSSKKHTPWLLKISNHKLAKVVDQIGRAIPEMRELYIFSTNLLKRLDLAGEWNELYSVIIGDLERETSQQNEGLQLIKEQLSLSGLSPNEISASIKVLLNSPVSELIKKNYSARNSLTQLEFLQQSLRDSPGYNIKTIPYLNGAQKVVVNKYVFNCFFFLSLIQIYFTVFDIQILLKLVRNS